MTRVFFFLGALSAFIGVSAGAFGAHGLNAVRLPGVGWYRVAPPGQ